MKLSVNLFVRNIFLLFLFAGFASFQSADDNNTAGKKKKILVFSKTNGFRHSSISAGIAAVKKLGEEHDIVVDATEDSAFFTKKNLRQYAAIIFLNTTGNVLGSKEEAVLQQYLRNGGGFAGIHAASDCEYEWPWYVKLIGGNFASHPKVQPAKLIVQDNNHPSSKPLPGVWERTDEWYNFKNLNPDVKVLLTIDESSYTGGKNGAHHPMAWYHVYDGGRVFYTALGHTEESYSEPLFLQHIWGGITYVMHR